MSVDKTYSIVLPAYNEEKTIGKCLEEIKKINFFDEIICVDNNSTDKTKKIILENNVTYLNETVQGFGAAVKKGLDRCNTSHIFIFEPDGSFNINDLSFFLEKNKTYENVFGSRYKNLNVMYLKFGNLIYGKIINLLFYGPRLTDVGCSFRLIKNSSYLKFKDELQYAGPEFQIELTLNLIKFSKNIIEIPVKYSQRIGQSNYTGNFFSSSKVAISMLKVLILFFFKKFF
jgi:glycosyltransferase involved in cell wall biosynthesis